MSLETFATTEKLEFVEKLIEVSRGTCRAAGKDSEAFYKLRLLKSIAADLRARVDGAPSVTLTQIESRIQTIVGSKTGLGYSTTHLIDLGYDVIGRWPVIKQSLELFASVVEEPDGRKD